MTEDELLKLMLSHFIERYEDLKRGKRLVHYTSAEAAIRIIAGRQLWLRNAQVMNDFSEIQHGISCIHAGWNTDGGKQLQTMLDSIEPGFREQFANLFDRTADSLKQDTYIASLSEHCDSEDSYGRLSMWRAYGGRSGVALVLNNTAFTTNTYPMRVFSIPVLYKDVDQFTRLFDKWARTIVAAQAALKGFNPGIIRDKLYGAFRAFALCMKHPGFAEEREWRVFHSPQFEGTSQWVEKSVEVVHGVPQVLIKLNLRDDLKEGISGVAPETLLNRVIIGPCQYPLQVHAAMVDVLKDAGIRNAENMISMSLIPIRH